MTTVLFIRHESRDKNEEEVPLNCLTQPARNRAFHSGRKLAELGYHITAAYSSPQGRAYETLQYNLAGNNGDKGPIPLNGVDPAFGDMLLGAFPYTPEEKAAIVTACAEMNISPEMHLVTAPEHAEKAGARGKEGADLIRTLVHMHRGGVIAIASHGGSRIEPMIDALCPRPEGAGITMVPPGGTVVLKFDEDDNCVSVEYLGNLGIKAEPPDPPEWELEADRDRPDKP